VSMRRYFYSDRGKDYMLVGVPWSWIDSAPEGDLIIDPTTTVTSSNDTYLQDATNFGSSTSLVIGKSSGANKKRTIIPGLRHRVARRAPGQANSTSNKTTIRMVYFGMTASQVKIVNFKQRNDDANDIVKIICAKQFSIT